MRSIKKELIFPGFAGKFYAVNVLHHRPSEINFSHLTVCNLKGMNSCQKKTIIIWILNELIFFLLTQHYSQKFFCLWLGNSSNRSLRSQAIAIKYSDVFMGSECNWMESSAMWIRMHKCNLNQEISLKS